MCFKLQEFLIGATNMYKRNEQFQLQNNYTWESVSTLLLIIFCVFLTHMIEFLKSELNITQGNIMYNN